MDNPDSDKFYTLKEAFNVLGRERYGEEWTGDELGARNRPSPEPPPVLLANKEDYQKESAAYQRRRQVRAELRRILWNGLAPAELFNAHDGVRIPIPPAHWNAKIFTFSISSGMAELADQVTSSRSTGEFTPPPTHKGLVLIDRHQFDLAIKDVASDKKTTAVADEEISVDTQLPEWWPRKPKTQADWRHRWARAIEIEREPAKWNVSSIAKKIAKEETRARTMNEETEKRAEIIRGCLGKMRTEGGPPEK